MDKKVSHLDFEILSLYRDNYNKKLLLTEIAKALEVNHRSVRLHLSKLEEYKILNVEKRGKLVYAFPSLKEDFVKFMVMTEAYVFLKDERPVIKELAKRCKDNKFCIVFGSYASYTEYDVSDIDIIINKTIDTDDLFIEVQQFEYTSLKKIPERVFKEILKHHIILKGYENFVDEVMRRYGHK